MPTASYRLVLCTLLIKATFSAITLNLSPNIKYSGKNEAKKGAFEAPFLYIK